MHARRERKRQMVAISIKRKRGFMGARRRRRRQRLSHIMKGKAGEKLGVHKRHFIIRKQSEAKVLSIFWDRVE